MKNLFSGATLVVLLSLTMSLFVSNQAQAQENAGGVELVRNGGWFIAACEDRYYDESSTMQLKNGELHMATLIFKLPKDCCLIEKRAYTMYYPDSEEGPFTLRVMPSGTAIIKFINNGGNEF